MNRYYNNQGLTGDKIDDEDKQNWKLNEKTDKVYNYLFALQKEDGKFEADVLTFKKVMTEEEFKEAFEKQQQDLNIVKGFEVVYLGYAYYKKEKDVVFSYGEIKIEKGEEDGADKQDTIQEPVK